MNDDDKISGHFTYGEVTYSPLAKRLGLNNDVPVDILPQIEQVADMILENVRAYFGMPVKITSWYRNPILNQMVGSKPTSQHIKGEAVDFTVPGISNMNVAKYIRENLTFDQLILERTWVHTSLITGNNRKQVLTCYDGRTYKKGLCNS